MPQGGKEHTVENERIPRIIIDVPNLDYRWALRRAAVDRRTNLSVLITGILTPWLIEQGLISPADADNRERVRTKEAAGQSAA